MPEITLPEVKLPDVKLPEGLRDMTRDDIVQVVRDVKLPKNIKLPEVDMSGVDLPDAIAERMPGRRRTDPRIPLLALTIVGAVFAAAWLLLSSSTTGPRIRSAVDGMKRRMNGESSDLIRYDDETDLGSLVGTADAWTTPTPSPTASDPYGIGSNGFDDAAGVAVGPGATSDEEMRAPTA
jgi:hypothetical protein